MLDATRLVNSLIRALERANSDDGFQDYLNYHQEHHDADKADSQSLSGFFEKLKESGFSHSRRVHNRVYRFSFFGESVLVHIDPKYADSLAKARMFDDRLQDFSRSADHCDVRFNSYWPAADGIIVMEDFLQYPRLSAFRDYYMPEQEEFKGWYHENLNRIQKETAEAMAWGQLEESNLIEPKTDDDCAKKLWLLEKMINDTHLPGTTNLQNLPRAVQEIDDFWRGYIYTKADPYSFADKTRVCSVFDGRFDFIVTGIYNLSRLSSKG